MDRQVLAAVHPWLGVSEKRLRDLVFLLQEAKGMGYEYEAGSEHGMVRVRKVTPPANQISAAYISLLYAHFDLYTRPNPGWWVSAVG